MKAPRQDNAATYGGWPRFRRAWVRGVEKFQRVWVFDAENAQNDFGNSGRGSCSATGVVRRSGGGRRRFYRLTGDGLAGKPNAEGTQYHSAGNLNRGRRRSAKTAIRPQTDARQACARCPERLTGAVLSAHADTPAFRVPARNSTYGSRT